MITFRTPGPTTFTPDQPLRWHYGEPVTVTYAGETHRGRITAISPTSAQWSCNGVYYCGDQEWTPDLYPMLPDRWEPHDEPVAEWLIALSSDSAHPDTSQPYFLDLIARIDELT